MASFNPLCNVCGAIYPEPHKSHDMPAFDWENLPNYARLFLHNVKEKGLTGTSEIRQILALVEGMGINEERVRGREEYGIALASGVIAAFITASAINVNLPQLIAEKLEAAFTEWQISTKTSIPTLDEVFRKYQRLSPDIPMDKATESKVEKSDGRTSLPMDSQHLPGQQRISMLPSVNDGELTWIIGED